MRVQSRAVRLEAIHAVVIEPGVVLPPGHYTGNEWRTGLETMGGDVSWAAPRYEIELTADQLASIGAADNEIDVTEFVRSGELTST